MGSSAEISVGIEDTQRTEGVVEDKFLSSLLRVLAAPGVFAGSILSHIEGSFTKRSLSTDQAVPTNLQR